MLPRTRYLARLMGLTLTILALSELLRRQATMDAAASMTKETGMLWLAGLATLASGLAVVLAHNIWRGGLATVLVTVLGWMAAFKGAAVLLVPAPCWVAMIDVGGYARFYYVYAAIPTVLGAYLVWAGLADE